MLQAPPTFEPDLREVVLLPASRALATPQPARRRGPLLLKWTRRAHLYFGIALLPWVFLYGVTALLFNHAEWFGDTTSESLDARAVATSLAAMPAAHDVADEALRRLSEQAASEGRALELVPGSEQWLGGVSLMGSSSDASARLQLDPLGRGGRLSVSPRAADPDRPAWTELERVAGWEPVSAATRDELVVAGRALARDADLELDALSVRRLPELRFLVRDEGRLYACDLASDGKLEVRPAEQVATLRERLLRLHVQHGDPGYAGVQRAWSLIVDAMGIAMVLWGISGIVMWWTIRPTRRPGLVALVAGTSLMAALALLVWRVAGLA